MFIRGFSSKSKTGSVPVYLNVYDLTPINGYAYWLGLGIYHSGVQVHGVEYAYGAHDHPTTGIFEGEPRKCPGFRFRKSMLIGRTDLGPREVRGFMEKLAEEYTGSAYHLISNNCNHFCNDVCLRLTGKPIPRWVNRLANIGFMCNCVLPVGLHVAAVRHRVVEEKGGGGGDAAVCVLEGERKKLRSKSSRYIIGSSSSSSSSSSTASNNKITPPSSTINRNRRWRSSSASSSVVVMDSSTPTACKV